MRLILLTTLALGGCQAGVAMPAPAPMAMPPALAPAAPATAPTPAVAPAAFDLAGRAETQGGPFAGAAVSATRLGDAGVLATANTGADGTFGLRLGGAVPEGALLKLTAVKGDRVLAAVVQAPAPRRVQQGAAIVLDEATTLAVLLLNPRLEAAGWVSLGDGPAVHAATVTATLRAFGQLARAGMRAFVGAPTGTRGAIATALAPNGQGTPSGALGQQLAGLPGLADQFQAASGALGLTIVEAVRAGRPAPPQAQLAPLTLGTVTASAVVLRASGGGGSRPRETSVGGAIVVSPGDLSHSGTEGVALSE
jgi:hypothetical protein